MEIYMQTYTFTFQLRIPVIQCYSKSMSMKKKMFTVYAVTETATDHVLFCPVYDNNVELFCTKIK